MNNRREPLHGWRDPGPVSEGRIDTFSPRHGAPGRRHNTEMNLPEAEAGVCWASRMAMACHPQAAVGADVHLALHSLSPPPPYLCLYLSFSLV